MSTKLKPGLILLFVVGFLGGCIGPQTPGSKSPETSGIIKLPSQPIGTPIENGVYSKCAKADQLQIETSIREYEVYDISLSGEETLRVLIFNYTVYNKGSEIQYFPKIVIASPDGKIAEAWDEGRIGKIAIAFIGKNIVPWVSAEIHSKEAKSGWTLFGVWNDFKMDSSKIDAEYKGYRSLPFQKENCRYSPLK